jgi:glycosyltransferase involved in cell wall biosynthesis
MALEVSGARDLRGAVGYAAGLAAAALLIYGFNVLAARRLSSDDFGTLAALVGGLLALTGPITALLGGAAMSTARTGIVPKPRWRRAVLSAAALAAVLALIPLPSGFQAVCWFAVSAAMSALVGWNRGLLIGLGRLGTVGVTLAVEGLARVAFTAVLVAAGGGLAGASAGLALGIAAAALVTELLVPRGNGERGRRGLGPGVALSICGLFFIGLAQFADVVAVRLASPRAAGSYAAAASMARLALYAQGPAAAFALRRSSVVGPRRAIGWSVALAVIPAALVGSILEVAPRLVLARSFGGRYAGSVEVLRLLVPAMVLAGLTLTLIQLMMGAGRTAWVWSTSVMSLAGAGAVFALARSPIAVAWTVVVVQAATLLLVGAHLRRLATAAERGGGVLLLNWRDTLHPQGGGSEVFVEEVAARLAASGWPVTVFCAAHADAPREETRRGVRFVRRGSWWSVYPWAALYHLLGRFGPHDVVVDVQNGVPFFAPLYCGRPVVVLVHHVHREHWQMVFGPRTARVGWALESRVAPRVYRHALYAAVSRSTKDDLSAQGIAPDRISVVYNGNRAPAPPGVVPKAAVPTVLFLGRLVPAKRIELLLRAAAELRAAHPGLTVRIAGRGLWEPLLRREAEELKLGGTVSFEGFVDESAKARLLAEAWVLALPSVKEGWGLAVVEAASFGTPAVAFRVGGLVESVVDGATGLLVDSYPEFVDALGRLLDSAELRTELGHGAAARATRFGWDETARRLETVLRRACGRGDQEEELADVLGVAALANPEPTLG